MKTFRIKLYEFWGLSNDSQIFAIETLATYHYDKKEIKENLHDRFNLQTEIAKMDYLYFENGLPVFGSDKRNTYMAININGQVIRLRKTQ